ncbi:hypothetical protein Pcinc_032823 [Petrolisthes cinctipes]|uniref:DNA (cytosine-5-)-methyltransferase n=1 Tax=Petrolisthes cinctipes TaxID=88211 RepID=A0AAE1ETI9_PETCI|nr:hypothetical protein Pcinc_032823 [Petrolisthes cinctipes]
MVETRQVKEENKTMVIDERDHVNQDQDERPPKRKRLELNLPGRCLVRNSDFGRLVWGKIPGWKEWPGVVVRHSDCGKRPPAPHTAWLFWFQDYRISEVANFSVFQVSLNNVVDFNDKHFPLKLSKPLKKAILESLEEARIQSGLSVMESSDLLEWGRDGLPGAQPFKSNPESCLSAKVMQKLWKIQLTVKKKLVPFPTSSSDASSSQDSNPTDAEERRRWKPKASLLNKVRAGEYDIESLCIACSRVDCLVVAPHPFFFGGLCSDCKVDFEDNLETRGEDNIHMYCTVCGSPGELLLCDARNCDRVFCVGCVELLVTPSAVSVIKKATTWTCFLCTPHHPDTHGLLLPRHSQDEGEFAETEEEVPEFDPASFTGQPLRVLSLFDGIATGLYVLEKLGLMVEAYFASEIDKGAISVAEFNHGSKVTSIGSVEDLTNKQIANMCPIDLLLGGSPCNDLSFVNPKRKGLMDPTGTGVLFFYYYRVLKEIQLCNKGRPLFWLFENVVHMAKTDSDCISLFLNCRPALVDAKHFTPQHRPRHFWGNLPGMRRSMPSDLGNVSLSHCLDKIGDRSAQVEKINCITTRPNSLKLLSGTRYPIIMNEHGDTPWITEIEKIFGFPAHYTDVGNLQVRERQSLLGRAWCVPVIRHLLTPLVKYYTPASTDTTTTTNPASTDTTTNPASTDTTTTNPASTDTTTTNPASTDTTTTNPASTDTTTTNPASTDTTTTNPASTDTTTTNPASTDTTTNPASTDTTTNPASTDTTTNPASTDTTTTNPASTDTTTTNPASTDTTTTNPASTDTTTTNPASTDTTTTTNPASTDTTITNPASTDTTTNPASTDTTTNPASTDTTTNPASTDTTTNPASTDTTTTNPASTDTTTTNPASTDTTTTNPASTDTTTTNPASTDTTTTNPASTDTTTTNPASTDTTTTNPASTDTTTTTNPASTDTTTTNPVSTDTTTTNPVSTDTTTTNPVSTDTTTTTNPVSTDTTTTTNPAFTDTTTTTNPTFTDTTTTTNPTSTDTTTNPAFTDTTNCVDDPHK